MDIGGNEITLTLPTGASAEGWYLRYNLSLRDLVKMMAERGGSGGSWRVDETCIKVRGRWVPAISGLPFAGKD